MQAAAAQGLGEPGACGGEEARRAALAALLRALNDSEGMVRPDAAEGLGPAGGEGSGGGSARGAVRRAGAVRLAALWSLHRLGCELDGPYLVRFLEDPEPLVCQMARRWLGEGDRGKPQSIPPLPLFGGHNRAASVAVPADAAEHAAARRKI